MLCLCWHQVRVHQSQEHLLVHSNCTKFNGLHHRWIFWSWEANYYCFCKKMPRAVSIFSTVMICPVMVLYVAMLAYLTLKPEATSKSVQSSEASSTGTVEMELEQGADLQNSKVADEI
nr:metal transporter Nramp5-like isoform X2 [Ipomoea batatas]GMD56255.1 metal transporter Nramp5-like isoform X2 [Ipomoea batatas]